jgi:hypothetical protein
MIELFEKIISIVVANEHKFADQQLFIVRSDGWSKAMSCEGSPKFI